METELNTPSAAPRPVFVQLTIAQLICMAALIIGLMCVKYISPSTFHKIEEWYSVHILDETSVNEVLGDAGIDEV